MKILRRLVDELANRCHRAHDINFASVYSDRIVAMKDGKVVKDGPTEEIIESAALKEIYDMDIPIQKMDGCRICVYFSS
jgi:iron complex transport system ATP-binding protein